VKVSAKKHEGATKEDRRLIVGARSPPQGISTKLKALCEFGREWKERFLGGRRKRFKKKGDRGA